jgi:glutathione peroxidase
MIRSLLLFFTFFFGAPEAPKDDIPKSIYNFKVEALDGGTIDFARFKGKKILIVNTASECGNTPQYEDLQALHEKYKNKLVIVGFPTNDFGKQEPGSNKDIAAFCKKNYGVTFPMAAKIAVTGENMAPIYRWLTEKEYNGYETTTVKWNFQKYLINEKGELVKMFPHKMKPSSAEIIAAIESK